MSERGRTLIDLADALMRFTEKGVVVLSDGRTLRRAGVSRQGPSGPLILTLEPADSPGPVPAGEAVPTEPDIRQRMREECDRLVQSMTDVFQGTCLDCQKLPRDESCERHEEVFSKINELYDWIDRDCDRQEAFAEQEVRAASPSPQGEREKA